MMVRAGENLRKRVWRRVAAAGSVAMVCLSLQTACMTPDRAVRETDETALRLATAYWQQQTGSTNAFDMHRAADALTLRLALQAVARGEQHVTFPAIPSVRPTAVSNAVLTLSLPDALCVAARNDRAYQKLKESVFTLALDLDYQQYQFETSFSGLMLATLTGDPGLDRATARAGAGASRTLQNGAEIAGALALDVVSLLRDDWRSLGITGDLTMTVPLLRGAGREIVLEPLRQAERNLIYALRRFEAYRQNYAVTVATAYYGVLEYAQRLQNALDNETRLKTNSQRADMMFEAGRMQRIQVDQARSDHLKAQESVISARKSFEARLDSFKMTIGLPPESRLVLDHGELDQLEAHLVALAKASTSAVEGFPNEGEAFRIALSQRHDLFITRCQMEDFARGVKIAEDALRADVALSGSVDMSRIRRTGDGAFDGEEAVVASVRADLPWSRRKERNAFKKQLIALEQAKRNVEELEDGIRLSVRNGLRNLIAARASYDNQVTSMQVAVLRVESNNLYLQSGRSSMRDVLEAESALLAAKNALCSAMIQWRVSELELRRDMGVLRITETGMWATSGGENHG